MHGIDVQVCGQCKRDLPAAEFHRSKSYNDGLYGKCKGCCATALSKRKAGQVVRRPLPALSTSAQVACRLVDWTTPRVRAQLFKGVLC